MKNLFINFITFCFIVTAAAQEVDQNEFRSLVNLSNYIANDYVNAVQDDSIINEFEYLEMQEFVADMHVIQTNLSVAINESSFENLSTEIQALDSAIQIKASPVEIKSLANHIGSVLLDLEILNNVPNQYPDIQAGKKVYTLNCSRCHGAEGIGNGPSAVGLDPAPTNFRDSKHIFPFHIYNTVQLGIEGTSMAPLTHLTEQETWDVAFYVMTLSYSDSITDESLYLDAASKVDLSNLANLTNAEISNLFAKDGEQKTKVLRFYEGSSSKEASLDLTLKMLQEAIQLYQNNDLKGANQQALDAYFVGFEPVEIELGATSPAKVTLIEKEMMVFRSYLSKSGNDTLLEEQYDKIAYHFESIKNEKEKDGFWFVFFASISILLREGLEALLIIVAILAALNSFVGGSAAKKYVHAGWLSALVLGVVSYFFAGKLIEMGSHKRELIEGFGALLAVVILLSVGFWLHDKSNAATWSKYVKDKLSKHLSSNSLWSIAILAFVVVFREAFESVIFLSSLTLGGGESSFAVLLGALFSAVLILIIAILIINFSKRLPIHQVFKISSITMIVLAVILAGKGIKELQEAAFVGVDLLNFRFSVDLLGLYPTYQSIGAQIVTLIIAFVLWFVNHRKQEKLNA